MAPADAPHILAACASALVAGAINSVAGGGTLISFPTLMWLGLPSVIANATSTVAIWPGSLGSIWGFRRELRQVHPRWLVLSFASFAGGGAGAYLLRLTPAALFDRLVPFLILLATVLFTVQGTVQKRLRNTPAPAAAPLVWLPGGLLLQFLIAIYGGYFGAGVSIMMLTGLSILGLVDILQMNALTSLFALCINGVAAVVFIWTGMVDWHYVLPMALAAMTGGYAAAGVARRIGRTAVRRFVIAVGFTLAAVLFVTKF
jgi:uncharacterized protein